MRLRRGRVVVAFTRRVIVAACLFLAGPGLSHAADDRAKVEARRLYREGMASYNVGDYARALERFKNGYRQVPDAVFLFDIGQCYRKLGSHRQAADMYRSYLRVEPAATNRAAVEDFIREADAALVATESAARAAAAESQQAQAKSQVKAQGASDATRSVPPRRRKMGVVLAAAGGGLAAAGASLVAYGTFVGNGAHEAPTLGERNQRGSTALGLSLTGATLLAVGGAGLIAGVLLITIPSSETTTTLWLAPTWSGVLVGGSF